MKLYKDFLKPDDFVFLSELLQYKFFPWYFYNTSLEGGEHEHDFMFVHTLFEKEIGVNSSEFINFVTLMNKVSAQIGIKHSELLRIKANMYTNRGKKIVHEEHTDYPNINSYTTAVYNLTTCNGGTQFKDEFIASEANSLLVFDGNTPHSGVTQSDTDIRLLVNFDFK